MTDYIKREDAIDCCECHGSQECKDRIKALPSAEAKWIPCNERLPSDENKEYIVIDSNGDMGVGYYRNDANAWDSYNFGWLERKTWKDNMQPFNARKYDSGAITYCSLGTKGGAE